VEIAGEDKDWFKEHVTKRVQARAEPDEEEEDPRHPLISEDMSAVVGVSRANHFRLVKLLWKYIKANDLQNPANRNEILCDEKLKKVFKRDKVTGFGMSKLLGQHIFKDGEATKPKAPKKKKKQRPPSDDESEEEQPKKRAARGERKLAVGVMGRRDDDRLVFDITVDCAGGAQRVPLGSYIEDALSKVTVRSCQGVSRATFVPNRGLIVEGNDFHSVHAFCGDYGDTVDLNALTANDISAILHTYGVEAARAGNCHTIVGLASQLKDGLSEFLNFLSLLIFLTRNSSACSRTPLAFGNFPMRHLRPTLLTALMEQTFS